jgi:hypothetical protein
LIKYGEVAGEAFQDLVGGLGPDERLWIVVPGLDPGGGVGFEIFDAVVGCAVPKLVAGL